jgi:uncharacterized membrane protein YccF (DUF307 family)
MGEVWVSPMLGEKDRRIVQGVLGTTAAIVLTIEPSQPSILRIMPMTKSVTVRSESEPFMAYSPFGLKHLSKMRIDPFTFSPPNRSNRLTNLLWLVTTLWVCLCHQAYEQRVHQLIAEMSAIILLDTHVDFVIGPDAMTVTSKA